MVDREASSVTPDPWRPGIRHFVWVFACALALIVVAVGNADAQSALSPGGSTVSVSGTAATLSPQRLQALVGRIAIYPDDLLALVLTAATQPLEIVEADRFLATLTTHPGAKPPTKWDPSVIALLNYPDVVKLMDSDLDWTEQLGTLVVDQRAAVLDAIQSFRREAYAAGNLRSNDKESVTVSSDDAAQDQGQDETISISPADPQVIYVPSYEPAAVVAPAPNDGASAYDWSPAYPYYDDPNATFLPETWFGGFVGFGFGWRDHQIFRGDDRDHDRHREHDRGDGGDRHLRLPPGVAIHGRSIWEPDHRPALQAQAGFTGRGAAEIRPVGAATGFAHPEPSIVARPLPQIVRGGSPISGPSSVQVFRGAPAIHRGAAMPPHSLDVAVPRFVGSSFARPHFAPEHFGAPMRAPHVAAAPSPIHGGMHR
jgi:hypothetical protein